MTMTAKEFRKTLKELEFEDVIKGFEGVINEVKNGQCEPFKLFDFISRNSDDTAALQGFEKILRIESAKGNDQKLVFAGNPETLTIAEKHVAALLRVFD